MRVQIDQLFLKQVRVRKFCNLDMNAGLSFVVLRRLAQRVAFDSRVNGEGEHFTRAAAPATRHQTHGDN